MHLSAEFTKGGDQLNEEDLLSLVHKTGAGEGSAYASRFAQFPVILDFWGTPIRHSNKEDGFEWRSAGYDREFGTPDDDVSEYRVGKVTRLGP